MAAKHMIGPLSRRHDVLVEVSQALHRLDKGYPFSELFGTANNDEIVPRLAGAWLDLLLRHKVDDRGRCSLCRPPRPKRRLRIPWPAGKSPCSILKTTAFFAYASPDIVWARLLPRIGIRRSLDEIRAHLANSAATHDFAGTIPIPVQADRSGRHAKPHKHITA